MVKYWINVTDAFTGRSIALLEGGETHRDAVKACDGNEGVAGVSIIGPMTREEALETTKPR